MNYNKIKNLKGTLNFMKAAYTEL